MSTTAKTGIGVLLQRGDGATPTEAFVTLAMVTSIKGPSEEAAQIDVTSLDSTGGYAEFIGGLKTGGQLVAEANFDENDTTYGNVRTDFQTNPPTVHNWKIVFPSPSTKKFTFAAFPLKLDHAMDPKSASKVTITLQITGQVTLS